MANIALNKPSGGQLILSPEDGTSTETVTIPSVGVGKLVQTVVSNDVAAPNTTIGNSGVFVEASSLLRTSITLKTDNPLLIINWIANLEADGSNDRPFIRFYYSINGGAYVGKSLSNLGSLEAVGGGQGTQAMQFVYETLSLTANAGDTITISPYYSSESTTTMQIQAGQGFGSVGVQTYFVLQEVAA